MSIKIIDLVMDIPFKPHHKLLMIVLADYANETGGSIYPSLTTLQTRTSLSRPTLVKLIRELKDDRFLALMQRGGVNQSSNRYQINVKILKDWLSSLTSKEIELVKPLNCLLVKKSRVTSKAVLPDPSLTKNIDPLIDNSTPAVLSTVKTRDIQKAYESCVPYAVDWVKGEGHAAKWLSENGYTPDDIRHCYADLKRDDFWKEIPLPLSSLKKQIGEWKLRRNGKQPIKLTGVINA